MTDERAFVERATPWVVDEALRCECEAILRDDGTALMFAEDYDDEIGPFAFFQARIRTRQGMRVIEFDYALCEMDMAETCEEIVRQEVRGACRMGIE